MVSSPKLQTSDKTPSGAVLQVATKGTETRTNFGQVGDGPRMEKLITLLAFSRIKPSQGGGGGQREGGQALGPQARRAAPSWMDIGMVWVQLSE